jgi:hypothetical protein
MRITFYITCVASSTSRFIPDVVKADKDPTDEEHEVPCCLVSRAPQLAFISAATRKNGCIRSGALGCSCE